MTPTLESQARIEAAHNLTGLRRSNETGLNSSITLAIPASFGLGLTTESWISNGTDFRSVLPQFIGGADIRLFPSVSTNQEGKVAFRGIGGPSDAQVYGAFTRQLSNNVGWTSIDSIQYDGNSLDLFVFDVDADGKALAMTPAITRATLERIS